MRAFIQKPQTVTGDVIAPGDKSLSHRALMMGLLANTPYDIENLAPGADVQSTARCMKLMGLELTSSPGVTHVRKAHGLTSEVELNCGNSGTTLRLLAGLLSGLNVSATLTGDSSLRQRPMKRIVEPLRQMGADILCREEGTAPLLLKKRNGVLTGRDFTLPVASAQVKSGLLLAGLFAEGMTRVIEPVPTRDHTENLLKAMGAPLTIEAPHIVSVKAPSSPLRCPSVVRIPGDASSAAWLLVAALLHPQGDVWVRGVNANPRRLGFLRVLERMGAGLSLQGFRADGIEPVADFHAQGGRHLQAFDIVPSEVPDLIDELPMLAVVATQASGRSQIRGAKELRVKESDRLAQMARGLNQLGASVEELEDGLIIHGPSDLKGTSLECAGDHRIAMAWTLAGLVAEGQTLVEGAEWAAISFPDFFKIMGTLTKQAVTTLESA